MTAVAVVQLILRKLDCHNKRKANAKAMSLYCRVATAQGKQGIWLLTFPDRENTGNLVNLFFYTGKMVPTQGKF